MFGRVLAKNHLVPDYTVNTVRTKWTLWRKRTKTETSQNDNTSGNHKRAETVKIEKIENAKTSGMGAAQPQATIQRQAQQHQKEPEAPPKPIIIPFPEVMAFINNCMAAVGTKHEHGKQLAEVLIDADYRGHFSHGLNRLEMYANDITAKTTVSDKEPTILSEKAASAYVDGENLLGPVVGNFSMQLAITKAKKAGIGWVTAKGSNHYGIAAYYSKQACKIGLLGLSFTNTSPLQVATRGKKPVLGTNPITLSAPGDTGDGFLLDMATSGAAIGKVELHKVKGIKIPNGWGVDANGVPTNDPEVVLKEGALLPLGGEESTSGYKGYGLAMLVEIFTGILGNADYGPKIRSWKTGKTPANLGQCFVAIDPDAFTTGFKSRMQHMSDLLREREPVDPDLPVLVAGDPELKHMAYCAHLGGIPYHPNLISLMGKLAEKLSVKPMKIKRFPKHLEKDGA